MLFFNLVVLLCMHVTIGDYADRVCLKKQQHVYDVGNANVTASDGNVLPVHYDCDGFYVPHITKCSSSTSPEVEVATGSTAVVKTDIGAKFYVLTCYQLAEPDLSPASIFVEACSNGEETASDEKSGDKQVDASLQLAKEATVEHRLKNSRNTVAIKYTVDCDQASIVKCTYAGGSRLKGVVAVDGGSTAYIAVNGTDYKFTCDKQMPVMTEVDKTDAYELCKDDFTSAWEKTVKSDYSTYPSKSQLVKIEDSVGAPQDWLNIVYELQCFGEPARIQRCLYTGRGRLRDFVAIPAGTSAFILLEDTELQLKCNLFAKAQLLEKPIIAIDDFCEDAIRQQSNERDAKSRGMRIDNKFSLDENEETTKVLKLKRPSLGTKIKVEMKALCFGRRPVFKSCRMKRKGNKKEVMAGSRSDCVDVGIGLLKAMTRLECNLFNKPSFTDTKDAKC